MTDTANAPERDDELLPCPFCGGEAWYNIDHTTELCNSVWCRACDFGVFDPNGTGSSVAAWNRRTHCDELVAAAYLDAARVPTSFLVGGPLNGIPFRSPMAHEVAEAIKDRTPDDASATLTAFGERMKAEGAREAQAKIARLTEALAIAGPIALKVFDYHLFTLDAEDQRKVETIRAALQENANG